jgi:hypothetical protein
MDLSEEQPKRLYPYMDSFTALLDSKYRILVWNTLAIIANLVRVDRDRKFDAVFDKYYGFLYDPYMVTVANVVGNSAKIALAEPYLVQRITSELFKVETISTTPHLTAECKRVIAEKAIEQIKSGQEAVDLSPQSAYIRRLQHLIAERNGLSSQSSGQEPERRVRIYKG